MKHLLRLGLLTIALPLLLVPCAPAQSIYGNALLFNNTVTNQYVTVPNFGNVIPTNEITVEFWADAYGFAVQSAFMLSPDQGGNRFNAHIDYGSSPGPGLTYWDFGNISSGGRVSTTSPPNSVQNWTHYALVASQSGNFMRIYTNGVLQIGQSGMTPFVRGNYNLQIAGPGFPLTGQLDELRVWSVARTPFQIQADMYSPLAGTESNLVVYYNFNSSSGNVLTNLATATGAAFNGITTNNPSWVASTNPLVVNVVTSTGDDSNPGTLRNVIANVPTGSVVVFAPAVSGQTIMLTNGVITLNKNLTIDATELPSFVQINANFTTNIFSIAGATVVLNSLLLTEGHASFHSGGDIVNNSGNVTINNCILTDSEAYEGQGGAIANLGGAMTINSSTFSANYASITPGYSALQNQAGGGAIYNGQANLTLNNCSFNGNYADESSGGGAIWCNGTLPVIVNGCNFAGNSAVQSRGGGAIYRQSGANLTVSNSAFLGNIADSSTGGGGAIYNQSGSGLSVANCTFFSNTATNAGSGGGAVCDVSGVNLAIINCTIVANTATNAGSGGGGIYTSGNLGLTNTIICSNSAATGAHIYCGGFLTTINTLLGVGSGPAYPGLLYYHNGFIDGGEVDTTNALLAPLANYGGPTQTMLPLPDSPAINAGVNSVTSFLGTDQRGSPRQSGANVDIGAVEVQPTDTNAAAAIVTSTADSGAGSLRFVAFLANLGVTNRITFASYLSGQTIYLTNGQIVLSTNLTVDASTLANGIQINGNNQSRIFTIANNSTVVLKSLTITKGYDDNDATYGGGGILSFGTLALFNCTVIGNQAENSGGGGGIYNIGTLTVSNSIVSGNDADFSTFGGGGIFSSGALTVSNSIVSGNSANDVSGGGGGIYASASLTVNHSSISNNHTIGQQEIGGGISAEGTLTINSSTIGGNIASGAGGGIATTGNSTINNSTIFNNQAPSDGDGDGGGGIACGTNSLSINNSTIVSNACTLTTFGGGGILSFGTLTMNSCTIVANQSDQAAGGILSFSENGPGSGLAYLTNSVFYLNLVNGTQGPEVTTYNGTMVIANCLLGPEGIGSVHNLNGSLILTNSLVAVSPLLAPLGNFGGSTQTMPPEPGSPAIGAGNVTAANQFSTDQRGPGFARVVLGKVDIGAVELQAGQSYPIVFNTLDSGPGSLREVVSNAAFAATITFDPSLSGQTITLTSGQIVLSNSPTISGAGLTNGIIINGNNTSRIFQVPSGTAPHLIYLTLANGNPGSSSPGGAILNNGDLHVDLCTLALNTSAYGGAIENENICALADCTLAANITTGGTGANGGAIDNNQGTLTLLQCTIVGNVAASVGGGIANYMSTLALTNSIIGGNSAGGFGVDIYNFGSGVINGGGTNIIVLLSQQGGSTFNGGSSLISSPPLLAPFGYYGGPTPTSPPLHGSPAIDGGSAAALAGEGFNIDQRGLPRVSGQRVDIGAVEVQIASAPYVISDLTHLANGPVQFSFTNVSDGSFTVFATTNVALPFNTWSNLGPALELPSSSGQFQFTDLQATNFSRRFYRISSP